MITFGMYPGVSLSIRSEHLDFHWFAVLIITTFNLFDTIGRWLVNIWLPGRLFVGILTICRFVFWLSFILIASDDPRVQPEVIFNSIWLKFLNITLFAVTNGFASTCLMIFGPMSVERGSKDNAGSLMGMGLVFGILCGTVVALSFSNVGVS